MLVCSVQIISHLDIAKVSSRCLHYISAAMLVHIWCAPTWLFHTKLCKFLRNISTNISRFGKTHRRKTWTSVLFIISNKITISWLYPLNGFRFIFLLRDSENDLSELQNGLYHVLGIASKIEPPTLILILYLLITEKDLSAPQDSKVPLYSFSCSTVSFITVNQWFGFPKGFKVYVNYNKSNK